MEIDLEGSMHSQAANPESDGEVIGTCEVCSEGLCVGDKVARDDDGLFCEDCWLHWANEQIFELDATHLESKEDV